MRENDGRKFDHQTLEANRLRAVQQITAGVPVARAGSAASKAATAGTTPASTASTGPDLDRTGRPRPQPHQDRHAGRLMHPRPDTFQPEQERLPTGPSEFFRSK